MVFACFRCLLWNGVGGGQLHSRCIPPIPLGLHGTSKDEVLASLLLSAPRSPRSVPPSRRAVPILVLAMFPVCPGQAVGTRLHRELPEGLPARSIAWQPAAGGRGGVALLSDPLVTRGSPLAQHAEVRRFSGGAGAWVSSRHSSGISHRSFEWHRSCWKPSGLVERGSRGRAGDLLPNEPGLCCSPFRADSSSPALPCSEAGTHVAPGALLCRQGWRDAGVPLTASAG